MKKKLVLTLLSTVACLGLASCVKNNNSNNDGVFTVCIASSPDTIDPALNTTVDGGTYDVHLFEGLYKWTYSGEYPNGSISLAPGLAKEAPTKVVNADGTVTYTYTIREDAKWSNGEDLTAADIVRSWKRAVSKDVAADYAYLFECIVGGEKAETEADGASLSVKAIGTKTLTVDLIVDISYWDELTAFPAFMPVYKTADNAGTWCTQDNIESFVCNGPMKIKVFDKTKIELVPNEQYTGTSEVKAKDITFAFSADDNAILNSYKSGSYSFIDSVPNDQIDQIKNTYKDEYYNVGQLGTYYVCWNINDSALTSCSKLDTEDKRAQFRNAVSKLINRQYLIDTVAKGGQSPATGFVSSGLLEPDGKTEWVSKNGENHDGSGYCAADDSKASEAVETLKSLGFNYDASTNKFTDIPTLKYLYNTGSGHAAIGEYLQGQFGKYGINISLENQEWAVFITERKAGNYSIARNGWLCDYNDPISMLDMWITSSGNNDVQFGKGDHENYKGYTVDVNGDGTISENEKNLSWADSYDSLISNIKKESDSEKRFTMMHNAETLLMSTGCITPLYFYTDAFMKKSNMKGFFASPLGYKFFYGVSFSN